MPIPKKAEDLLKKSFIEDFEKLTPQEQKRVLDALEEKRTALPSRANDVVFEDHGL